MKKITISLLMVILSALTVVAQYAPISTIGTVNSNLDSLVVPIRAINFTNVMNANLRILYDPAILTAIDVSLGNPAMGSFVSSDLTVAGVISISWFTSHGVTLSDNSKIFNLVFFQVANGTSAISFDDTGNGYSCRWGDGNYNRLISW